MALTPEDVVNKRFQSTKFREGYDQDEVDDFLDDVVVELRRLTQENEELHKRLEAAESASVGPAVGGSPVSSTEFDVSELDASGLEHDDLAAGELDAGEETPDVAPEASEYSDDSDQPHESAPSDDLERPEALDLPSESASEVDPTSVTVVPTVADAAGSGDSTSGLLQLARRLHDEHVREGALKREALIADGEAAKAQAIADGEAARQQVLLDAEQQKALVVADAQAVRDQVVADGHLEAERILAELADRQRVVVEALAAERLELEERVEGLQEFEREYREQLRNYIEGQLRELDSTEGDAEGDVADEPGGSDDDVSGDDDLLRQGASRDDQ